MKEATGEVSMTVITIVAIAAIGAILAGFWGPIKNWIGNAFNVNQSVNLNPSSND